MSQSNPSSRPWGPEEKNVPFTSVRKGSTSVVIITPTVVYKEQVKYRQFDLLSNELRKLVILANSTHVPKQYGINEYRQLVMENCGECITKDNLPANYIEQFNEILLELHDTNITHRDIRPENFLVQDEVIKLIDFGWAVSKGESYFGPAEIGDIYRHKVKWNDAYSMELVIKHFENAK